MSVGRAEGLLQARNNAWLKGCYVKSGFIRAFFNVSRDTVTGRSECFTHMLAPS